MARKGCYYCKRALGKFQYRRIGLCPSCRGKVARELGRPVNQVTLADVPGADYGENHHEKNTP